MCVLFKNQKKKKTYNTLWIFEFESSPSDCSTIDQFEKNKKTKKRLGKKIIIHLGLSLSLLFGRIDAALTLLVTSVLLLTSTLTIGKTTMVTMAAMVTRLVRSKYDPTYNRVRWVVFLLKVRIDLDRGGSTCFWGQDLVIRSSKSLSLPPFIYFICLPRIIICKYRKIHSGNFSICSQFAQTFYQGLKNRCEKIIVWASIDSTIIDEKVKSIFLHTNGKKKRNGPRDKSFSASRSSASRRIEQWLI